MIADDAAMVADNESVAGIADGVESRRMKLAEAGIELVADERRRIALAFVAFVGVAMVADERMRIELAFVAFVGVAKVVDERRMIELALVENVVGAEEAVGKTRTLLAWAAFVALVVAVADERMRKQPAWAETELAVACIGVVALAVERSIAAASSGSMVLASIVACMDYCIWIGRIVVESCNFFRPFYFT